jgi:hypothetical protein
MKRTATTLLTLALATALPLAAQDTPAEAAQEAVASTGDAAQAKGESMDAGMQAMMEAWQKASTPGPQHQQLADHFVGQWTAKQTMWMDPAAPPMTQTGSSSSETVLGGRQVRSDFSGSFMGQPFQGIGYSGYDNVTGRYTSTWADNMSTGTLLAYGDYDPTSKTYTFKSEMADPMQDGAMVPIRMDIRIVDADHHVFDMYETRDGKEARTMRIEYSRAE